MRKIISFTSLKSTIKKLSVALFIEYDIMYRDLTL